MRFLFQDQQAPEIYTFFLRICNPQPHSGTVLYTDLILKDDTETNTTTYTFCYNLWLHMYPNPFTGPHTNEGPGDVQLSV